MLEFISDLEKVLEDSEKVIQLQNEMLRKHKENVTITESNHKSINNLMNTMG
jgi:hypothetical protein